MEKRRYTDGEKRQLIANLDIEVAHRSRQLKAELEIKLETFGLHQLAQISRIPKQIRNMTMRDFGEKYEGSLQSALRGYQKERLAAAGIDASKGEIDRSERKRKWVASQEVEADVSGSKDSEPPRSLKNARTQLSSPNKAGSSTDPGTAQRSRLTSTTTKTPKATRISGRPRSSSPKKRLPFNNTTSKYIRPPSPVKAQLSKSNVGQQSRVPSSSTFNPALPPKTPSFPSQSNTTARLPRKDENLLSINGSPLANPYEFGLGWFKGLEMQPQEEESEPDTQDFGLQGRTLKRTKSSIVIRRDPSVTLPSDSSTTHSRTDSQLSFYTASSQTTSSTDSRQHSHIPQQPPSSNTDQLGPFRFPSSINNNDSTPRPIPKHARSFSALVAIPTKDGHVLEFDPLQTSPGTLDALEGISNSAKKQARVEMGRLIQATVDKWKIR